MASDRAVARRFDVAIDGGLVGCVGAGYLARACANVIVIEHGDLNREAFGRTLDHCIVSSNTGAYALGR